MKELQWSNEQFQGTWKECTEWAKNLREAGCSDWRLPTIKQLIRAFSYKKGKPKKEGFKSGWYWSAISFAPDSISAWIVSFNVGDVGDSSKTNSYYARCIREEK